MIPFDTAMIREDAQLESTSKSIMNWGPKTPWNLISNTMEDTKTKNPSPPQATQIATKSNPHSGAETMGATALAKIWAANDMGKETQESLPTGRHTVVTQRKDGPGRYRYRRSWCCGGMSPSHVLFRTGSHQPFCWKI